MTKLKQQIESWEEPIEWDEQFKWPGTHRSLTFKAKGYRAWMRSVLPQIKGMKEGRENAVPCGDRFVFYLRALPVKHMAYVWWRFTPQRGRLEIYRTDKSTAFVMFDARVNIPVLGSAASHEPWMSLTPNEILTQRGQIRRTKGDVGMAGLGMGWAARRTLERKKVEHLTVVEREESVIDMFGAPLKEEFGDKLTLVHSSAYEYDWMQHDVAVWDIWQSYGGARWDNRYKEIRNKMQDAGKTCIGWGEGVRE